MDRKPYQKKGASRTPEQAKRFGKFRHELEERGLILTPAVRERWNKLTDQEQKDLLDDIEESFFDGAQTDLETVLGVATEAASPTDLPRVPADISASDLVNGRSRMPREIKIALVAAKRRLHISEEILVGMILTRAHKEDWF